MYLTLNKQEAQGVLRSGGVGNGKWGVVTSYWRQGSGEEVWDGETVWSWTRRGTKSGLLKKRIKLKKKKKALYDLLNVSLSFSLFYHFFFFRYSPKPGLGMVSQTWDSLYTHLLKLPVRLLSVLTLSARQAQRPFLYLFSTYLIQEATRIYSFHSLWLFSSRPIKLSFNFHSKNFDWQEKWLKRGKPAFTNTFLEKELNKNLITIILFF
jgi:hypothetical protein